MRTLA